MTSPQDLNIDRLGAHGDGVAHTPSGAVFVPYALPGETVRAEVEGDRGRLLEVVSPAAGRVAPLCRHFTTCGGCTLQHMAGDAIAAWKRGLVETALSQQGLTGLEIAPVVTAPLASRRRAVLAARRTRSGAVLGFHEAKAHEIVDIAECPILSVEITMRLPELRALAEPLLSRSGEARLTVTVTPAGVDVAVEDAKPTLTADERGRIGELARAARIARLSLAGDTIYATGEPAVRFGSADVVPAPGAFLQAVPEIEAAMVAAVVGAVGKAKRVADLFCGAGTFTFPLAARAEVLAADGHKVSVEALQKALPRVQGVRPITVKLRDLFREPLSVKELEPFEAVVFDPPRAGASAQAGMLARSVVPVVVAVSCAPATLARDLKTLVDGGYVIESVRPFDQFLFSAHVEAVAVLRRPKRRRA